MTLLIICRAMQPPKTIYIIDSIPRLASSSGYGGYTTGSYNYPELRAMARPFSSMDK